VAVFAAAVFGGFVLYGDVGELSSNLGAYAWWTFGAACALALVNYGLRFLKWHFYLRCLGIRTPLGESATIFLAGFVMSITPAKLGEVLKAALLRDRGRATIAESAPVVIAERLTDVLALVLLIAVGVFTYQLGGVVVVVAALLVLAFVALMGSRRLVEKLIGRLPVRIRPKVSEAYDSMARLVTPRPLAVGVVLSVAAWFAECAGFWIVCRGFPNAPPVSIEIATFIYSLATLAGALSMLPGGLGVTEGSMAGMLQVMVTGFAKAPAVVATLLVRFATLWFAVAIGFVALAVFRARYPRREKVLETRQGS
jgi:uncharacterized protein (TIRG00374 family)